MQKFTALLLVIIGVFIIANLVYSPEDPTNIGKESESFLSELTGLIQQPVEEGELVPVNNSEETEEPVEKDYDISQNTTYKVVEEIDKEKPAQSDELLQSTSDTSNPAFLFQISPGVNLAGAEFAPNDDSYQHIYPTESLEYYAKKRMKLVRLPFLWERMQPTLNAPLDPEEISRMDAFLAKAEELNMYVILDLHNYARYNGEVVGTQNVPASALSDLWIRMVEQYKDHPAVIAYGIMNEPHDTENTWRDVAQEVVTDIRTVDQDTILMVCGDGWSGAWSWKNVNNNMLLDDPADKIVYEAHVYFDPWNVGAYNCTYDTCDITDTLVSERIDPFLEWLSENNAFGFIGEYGVPSDDSRWIDLMAEFYSVLDQNNLGSTIWAGGPNWGDYVLSVEPERTNGQVVGEKPQIKHLESYLVNCDKLGNGIVPECIVRLK